MTKRYWFTCDSIGRGHAEKPCLFDEETVMRKLADPPRCIRHGALLFCDSTLDGMYREQAQSVIRKRMNEGG